MYYVKAHIARTRNAQHRVGIGAIIIELPTDLVYHTGYFYNIGIEQAQRIGIGHHNRRNIRAVRLQQHLQMLHFDAAGLWIGLDLHGFVVGQGRASRIGAMRIIGDQDEIAMPFVATAVVGFDQHQPGQLTMCPGRGLQGHAGHPRNFC